MGSPLPFIQPSGKLCKVVCFLFLGILLLSLRLRVEESEVEPANTVENNENTVYSTNILSAIQTEISNPKLSPASKVEMKTHRTRLGLREKLQQIRLNNVLRKEQNGTAWIISYPGKYLKFPHNFEKVCEKGFVHLNILNIPAG